VHIVCEECIDRGDLTLEKLRRDIIEPSSIEVQGVHRNNSLLSLEREKVIEHSVNRISGRCASSKRNSRRQRRIIFKKSFGSNFDKIP
jgi:hypothetical protein